MEQVFGCDSRFQDILVRVYRFQYDISGNVQPSLKRQALEENESDAVDRPEVQFMLALTEPRQPSDIIDAILTGSDNIDFGFKLNYYSLKADAHDPDTSTLPSWSIALIVLGSLGVVTLITGCTICGLIKRRQRIMRFGEDDDEYFRNFDNRWPHVGGPYFIGRGRPRLWKTGNSISSYGEEINPYDTMQQERMRHISRRTARPANIDWTAIQRFARGTRSKFHRSRDVPRREASGPYLGDMSSRTSGPGSNEWKWEEK